MRVLVCGGRTFYDKLLFRDTMNALHAKHSFTVVIHGGASGADTLAGYWAQRISNLPIEVYKPEWKQGRSAGPKRNAIMLKQGKPDLVVAFPGGTGTADMVKKARAAGVEVLEVAGSRE